MLGKLLKYDLKYMLKNMSVFYVLTILFALLTRLFNVIGDVFIFNILSSICSGVTISMMVSILINTMMRSWVRFNEFIYKDESYLTHTLPVTKNDIYDSKFIQSLIFFGIGFCIILLGLFIAYYSKENWEVVKSFVMSLTTGLNINGTLLIIGLLFIVFLEIFNAIQCGFLGMILGYKQNNSKLLLSVCFGFIAYIVSQSLVLLTMFIVALFDEGLMQIFKNTIVMEPSTLKLLVIVTMVIYIVLIFIMNIVSKKVFSKGVDIE